MPPQEVPFPVEPPVVQPPPQVQRNWLERAGDRVVDTMRPYTPPEVRGIAKDVAGIAPYLSRGMDFQEAGQYASSAKERFLDAWSADISRRQQAKNSASASLDALNSIGAYLLGMTGAGGAVRAGKQMLSSAQLRKAFGQETTDPHYAGSLTTRKIKPETHTVTYGTQPQDFRWDFTPNPDIVTPVPKKWEDLEGSLVVPLMADRLNRGLLEQVGPYKVNTELFGGPHYMGTDALWAMNEQAARSWRNAALRARDEHKLPVQAIYHTMKGTNLDATIPMSETLVSMVRQSNIPKKDVKEFDAHIRSLRQKKKNEMVPVFPNWPGLNDPDAVEYLRKGTFDQRSAFADTMSGMKWRNKGFPDVPEVRGAMTVPELVGVRKGHTGYRIGTPDLDAPFVDSAHPNYDVGIPMLPGSDVGTLPQLPYEDVFAPWLHTPEIITKKPQEQLRSMMGTSPGIVMDPQLVEALTKSLERQNR